MMPMMNTELNERCTDVIREVGNIGAGNAMTALATMIDDRIDMQVPSVGLVPLSHFAEIAGGPETIAACIYMPVEGDAPGHVAFLLPTESAFRLADKVLYRAPGETQELGELECSALMEIGNIVASSYLVALCELTQLNLLSCPPSLAVDMTAAILCSVASALESLGDQAVTIITHIGEAEGAIEGFFLYIPEPGSLNVILRALQMEG
jgi:chemotaxis protein CheC